MKKLVSLIVLVLIFGLNACTRNQQVNAPVAAPAMTEQSQAPAAEQEAAPAAATESEAAPAAATEGEAAPAVEQAAAPAANAD